jgi:hypothetical protein
MATTEQDRKFCQNAVLQVLSNKFPGENNKMEKDLAEYCDFAIVQHPRNDSYNVFELLMAHALRDLPTDLRFDDLRIEIYETLMTLGPEGVAIAQQVADNYKNENIKIGTTPSYSFARKPSLRGYVSRR